MPATAAVVLPDFDGPTSATAPRSPCRSRRRARRGRPDDRGGGFSVATSRRPHRAITNRHGTGPGTSSGARSRRRAKRGRPSTPSGRRLAVPTLDRPNHLITPATAATMAAWLSAVHPQYSAARGRARASGFDHAAAGATRGPTLDELTTG